MEVTKKIKAALFARDLISSQEDPDKEILSSIRTVYAVAGKQFNAETATEEEVLATIDASKSLAPINALAAAISGPDELVVATPATAAATPSTADVAAAERRGEDAGTNRAVELIARSKAFNVSEQELDEAVASGRSVDAITGDWIKSLADRQRPVVRGEDDGIRPGLAQADKFIEAATEICISQAGGGLAQTADREVIRDYGSSLLNSRCIDLARREMQMSGGFRPTGNDEDDALAWMQFNGTHEQILASDGGAADGPGNHPNLLSALANKALNRPYPTANVAYSMWTARMPDLPDFKPKAIIDTGIFNQLDRVADDEMPKQKRFDSELASWMQADRFANRVGLTVVMVANDDLGGFARQLSQLAGAAESTLNQLCLNLLGGNVLMIDGDPLFHANHNNLITSGGAPSAAQASAMRLLHRQQTHINDEGAEVPLDEPPSVSLHPSAHEDSAKQVFMKGVYDSKVAQTDATINTVRGEINPIITARLDSFSATEWYTFVDPNLIPTIAHAFMRGYGAGGRRTTWFENGKGTRWYSLEARFTAAAISHRGAVKNPGA